ncbi:hypothetical protein PUNSTDRAFT_143559 [Punctularia strigosozonata HHB-11173 SS5]|uniref:uncharacterized protein n=1 Tax=Punctularia strigosozonata (strain HHB-11173) TaxID=741275 RepID=UPI000441850F|nr:uncharacterized protein PUNSTDRAFT_143559 [Punctularia strigosozonata HHB-11173 SS5]EIN08858.1 hypothetical protein PUNSTDRAFT_143559 [Punctularia strigosozonata HHB-11173 SS5]
MDLDDLDGSHLPPWVPRLALTVREITSVLAVFVLATEHELSDFSFDEDDEYDERLIADALSKGLSINVNGAPWQRVIMRVDEHADEAIIIIYGLMPGRQYDIELALIQGDDNIREQITTEAHTPHVENELREADVHTVDYILPAHDLPSPGSSSPLPAPPVTVEERTSQLQQTLTALVNERDTLTGNLKSARRDAQKADAALRAEIEALKRASEKQAAAEHRARQKILALQEAVKQATSATRETDDLVKDLEKQLPDLRAQKEEKEKEYQEMKQTADKARQERDKSEKCRRKKADGMKNELTTLGNKLDKLHGKREKLENEVISNLEEQLKKLEMEVERTEAEDYSYAVPGGDIDHDPPTDPLESPKGYHGAPVGGHASFSRRHGRYSSHGHASAASYFPRTSGAAHRPGPIQRPTTSAVTASGSSSSTHSRLPGSKHAVAGGGTFVSRAQQSHVAPEPRGRGAPEQSHGGSPGIALSASISRPGASSATSLPSSSGFPTSPSSTLSSRAAPFEPSGRGHANSSGSGMRTGASTSSIPNSASDLNPASVPFEPKTILSNPNRHPPGTAGARKERISNQAASAPSPRAAAEESAT